jgi:CO dehydrogenase maturation factor
MAITIAISGKGGSGKTTVAAMIIRALLERVNHGAVLAVDADPNACLGLALGIQSARTVADIREEARTQSPSDAGMDKVRSVEYGIQQAIIEDKGFDLLTMGRPEGPSCYCAVNNLLRQFLDTLSSRYQYVVLDNEAGMEHLSRRTTNDVDLLCIVTEPTYIGRITAKRITALADQLPVSIKHMGIIWNKADSTIEAGHEVEGIDNLGTVPFDPVVAEASQRNKSIFELGDNSKALFAIKELLDGSLSKLKIGTTRLMNEV